MKHPVTIAMVVLSVVSFGLISLQRTATEFMPPMDLPFLGAFIPYFNATPAQVEKEIAIPAEGEFQTLPGLAHMSTNSSRDGCFISLNFEWGVDMTDALADVRDRIERLRLVLPKSADRIFVQHFKLETFPVMMVGLSTTGDNDRFVDLVDRELLPKLQRVDGVADVKLMGYDAKSIMVDIDQQAMLAHGVSLYEFIMTLSAANVDMGVGQLYDGSKKHYVRVEGKMQGIGDYANLRLSNGLHVKDVASGSLRAREEEERHSIDGKPLVVLMVTKDSEANTTETCDGVLKELEKALASPKFSGTKDRIFFNQGKVIQSALTGLEEAALVGAGLCVAVVFFFLWRVRPTLIVAMAIPGSMVVAFLYMYATGMSLNIITMMSLIIAVGMVVDDSIVVIENIYRHQDLGETQWESARKGASEVSLAVVASTATSVAVFTPVFFMQKGIMSVFMQQFAIPVAVSLTASLFISLTVIPLAVSRLKIHPKSPMERYRRWRESGGAQSGRIARSFLWVQPIRWIDAFYRVGLHWSIRNRLAALLVLVAIVALTAAVPMRKLPFKTVPQVDRRVAEVNVELEPNFDMQKAGVLFDEIESLLDARRKELGIRSVYKNYSVRGGELQLFLDQASDLPPGADYPYTTDEVVDILWDLLPERAPGARLTVSTGSEGMGGGGGGMGGSQVSLRLQGDDAQQIDGYADALVAQLERVPGLSDVRKNVERAQQEIQLKVDNVLAEQAGIDATQVAQTVGFALMGTELSRIKQGSREIQVWAQFQEADRRGRANLDNVMLSGKNGTRVTLNQLVTTRKGTTPQTINRRDGKNFVIVTASVAKGDFGKVTGQLGKIAAEFALPVGYSLDFGDEIANMQEDMTNFGATLIMAVLLIYIVMAALFESLVLPLSILTSVPLAFLGVAWTVYLAHLRSANVAMDTIGFIGCVLMVGVVVKNGIVIVDHVNQLRKGGLERFEAVMQGGSNRLRPVLMTALATILGAVPLMAPLISPRWGSPATISLGCAMIGGLITGTVLTLFVVPLFYTLVDDFQTWLVRYFGGFARLVRRAPPTPDRPPM
jgi:HAE1 family hydrophobic/amphiphilic exporter-1